MTGQVLGFVRSGHRLVYDLLPWFVNGTLEQDERVLVEQHLQECAACRRELEWLEKLSTSYLQSDLAMDAERPFARMATQLQAQAGRNWLQRFFSADASWLKFALAMQLGVIVALGWALLVHEPAQYRALGAAQMPVRAAGSVIVVFNPATPASEVQRILGAAGARVVDGPTAANGYVLVVAGTPAAALAQLRVEPAVILAEALQAEEGQ